jgi:RHS repeat-associated protein
MTIPAGLANAGTYYYSHDGLGSVRTVTDSSGTLENKYDYLPFGGPYSPGNSANVEQRYTYAGRETNAAASTMYYRYRAYDPRVARFGGRDPIGSPGTRDVSGQQWQLTTHSYDVLVQAYAFVGNQPLTYIDPYGLDWTDPTWGGGSEPIPPNAGVTPSRGNCWRYASNDPVGPGEEHFQPPPGWNSGGGNTCASLMGGLRSLGAINPVEPFEDGCCGPLFEKIGDKCCIEGDALIFVVLANKPNRDQDVHFYRYNPSSSTWGHKPGNTPASDQAGRDPTTGAPTGPPVTDPATQAGALASGYAAGTGFAPCGQLCLQEGFDTDASGGP